VSKRILINKNKGILFWVTGLSGSGKTAISKKIKNRIIKLYGPTIEVSGDNFRKVFKLTKYDQKERIKNLWYYHHFSKLITNQKVNLIFNLIGMIDKARNWNRKNIDNYVEIYVKVDVKRVVNRRKKNLYLNSTKNIVGMDIKAELPKKPHIILNNNFNRSIKDLSSEAIKKIKKLI
jgi:adenylylsulfate kinase|tara:strand:- start:211 stop:741 length:531 start_codon:yes stop_codon:yes gene_type:complete